MPDLQDEQSNSYGGPIAVPATLLRPHTPQHVQHVCHSRLRKEFDDTSKNPPNRISAGPVSPQDLQSWTALLMIPSDQPTPYAGGLFALNVAFPDEYPRAPPLLTFSTAVFHPNVDREGTISGLRVLNAQNWSPIVTLEHVLIDLEALLGAPDLDHAIEPDAARAYVGERERYEETARDWTRRFAMDAGGGIGDEFDEKKSVV